MTIENQAIQTRQFFQASQESFGKVYLDQPYFDSFSSFLGNLIELAGWVLIVSLGAFFVYTLLQTILTAFSKESKKSVAEVFQEDFYLLFSFLRACLQKLGSFFVGLGSFLLRKKLWLTLIIIAFLGIWTVAHFNFLDLVYVQPGQKIVNLRDGKMLGTGRHLIFPFFAQPVLAHVANYDFDVPEITAYSKEPQEIKLHVNFIFQLKEEELFDFYSREGVMDIWEISNSIVSPRAIERLKKVVNQYSYKEIFELQDEIKAKALQEINKDLNKLGIILRDLNFVNILISEEYVSLIQERELVEESMKLAKQRLAKEKLFTQQELEIAKREKQIKILEAEGIAEANKRMNSQGVSQEIIQLKKTENQRILFQQWDGSCQARWGIIFL